MKDFKQLIKDQEKALHNEPFQVVLKLSQETGLIRLTYSKYASATIIGIEQLNDQQEVLTWCTFKGRTILDSRGDTDCSWQKDLKKQIASVKPSDWEINDCYVESYYLRH